jgi:hypothetical protein
MWSGDDQGVLLLHDDWIRIRTIDKTIEDAETWEEFRNALPPGEYERLVEREMIEDPPDPFDPMDISGFGDGDYPPWLDHILGETLPPSFVREFAKQAASADPELRKSRIHTRFPNSLTHNQVWWL